MPARSRSARSPAPSGLRSTTACSRSSPSSAGRIQHEDTKAQRPQSLWTVMPALAGYNPMGMRSVALLLLLVQSQDPEVQISKLLSGIQQLLKDPVKNADELDRRYAAIGKWVAV